MDYISFKNFRRFQDFPSMLLGDITLFVGGNNAGKSTIAKAIMLVTDNIKALHVIEDPKTNSLKPYFRFDTIDPLHNLHVSDFERALHRGSESKEIMLSATFNGTEISFFITSDVANVSEQGPTAPISKIVVKNRRRGESPWIAPMPPNQIS